MLADLHFLKPMFFAESPTPFAERRAPTRGCYFPASDRATPPLEPITHPPPPLLSGGGAWGGGGAGRGRGRPGAPVALRAPQARPLILVPFQAQTRANFFRQQKSSEFRFFWRNGVRFTFMGLGPMAYGPKPIKVKCTPFRV